jgi:hypothetical protein
MRCNESDLQRVMLTVKTQDAKQIMHTPEPQGIIVALHCSHARGYGSVPAHADVPLREIEDVYRF